MSPTLPPRSTLLVLGAFELALVFGSYWFLAVTPALYILAGTIQVALAVWIRGPAWILILPAAVDIANGAFYLPLDNYGIPVSIFASSATQLFTCCVLLLAAASHRPPEESEKERPHE